MLQIDRLEEHNLGRSGPRKKTGCFTCRRRKVRCDETKPVCRHCLRLKLRCQYKQPTAAASAGAASPESENVGSGRDPLTAIPPSPSQQVTPVGGAHNPSGFEPQGTNNAPQSNESRLVFSPINLSPGICDDHPRQRRFRSGTVNVDQLFHTVPTATESQDSQPELKNRPFFGSSDSATSPVSPGERRTSIGQSDKTNNNNLAVDAQFLPTSNGSIFYDSPGSTAARSAGDTLEQQQQRGEVTSSYLAATSYQEQLLQHFLHAPSPVAIFAPLEVEWDLVKETMVSVARGFGPLMNAICCYSGVHQSRHDGRSCQWVVPYYRAAIADLQTYITDDVGTKALQKVFATAFFVMMAELIAGSELGGSDTSLLRSSYRLLRRYHSKTNSWRGPSRQFVAWIILLDVKAMIAGRNGDLLAEPSKLGGSHCTKNQDEYETSDEGRRVYRETGESCPLDEFQSESPNFLAYNSLVNPVLDFYVETQKANRRIVQIDLHHRARGTLSDEYEVLQIAHKISADLEVLWHSRPSAIDLYDQSEEKLHDILAPRIATHVCRMFRAYVANFLAQFIYLHRVAFSIYPRTERVTGAVNKIIGLAALELDAAADNGVHRPCAPASFLWPLFIAGLEASDSQRKWIEDEMRRMAEADLDQRHPNVEKALLLFGELGRRQNVLKAAADSRCVRRELFTDFFVMI